MNRNGQFAMEYLLVISFSVLLLIPITSLVASEYTNVASSVDEQKADNAMKRLLTEIEAVHAEGSVTRKTLDISVGEDIQNLSVDNETDTITLSNDREYYSNVDIEGDLDVDSAVFTLQITALEDSDGTYVKLEQR